MNFFENSDSIKLVLKRQLLVRKRKLLVRKRQFFSAKKEISCPRHLTRAVIITENDADVVLRIVRFGSGDSVQDSRDLDFWAAKRTRFIDHRSLSNVLGLGTSRLQLEVTSSSFSKTFHPDTGPPARSNRNSNDRGSA